MTTAAEPAFSASPLGQALTSPPYGHQFSSATEIGAATGIEFLDGGILAAAEPTRRGGGSAMVVRPLGRR